MSKKYILTKDLAERSRVKRRPKMIIDLNLKEIAEITLQKTLNDYLDSMGRDYLLKNDELEVAFDAFKEACRELGKDKDLEDRQRLLPFEIVKAFEDFLSEKGISIANEERDEAIKDGEDPEQLAIIYGSDFGLLEDKIKELLDWGNKR